MKHGEFITCHTVLLVKNIDNVFEPVVDGFTVIGQFLDLKAAEGFREIFADSCQHGDRLIVISVYPEQEIAEIDVLVVVDASVN